MIKELTNVITKGITQRANIREGVVEETYTIVTNRVGPYSLYQSNSAKPAPVWAKVAAGAGFILLLWAMLETLL